MNLVYEIHIEHSAERDLKRLSKETIYRIADHIRALGEDPRPSGCLKLKGSRNDWRIRVGNYRVIYEIDDETKKVFIMHVRKRANAY